MPGTIRGQVTTTTLRLDADGRIVLWPDTARDMFDRAAVDAVGQPLACVIESRQRGACENVVAHLCREPKHGAVHTLDLLAERSDGSTFPLECSLWCARDLLLPGGVGFEVLLRDVSRRARLEQDLRQELRDLRQVSAAQRQELRDVRARLTDITETINEVFWIADADVTRMMYISPGYERVWGRSCASLYEDPRSFIEAIHPDDRQRVADDLLVQRSGKPFDHEYRIVWPDGSVRWVWDRGYPVKHADGSVSRYIGVAQDITRRRASEIALRRQEMLDAIGHMAGGLAHDFNNVLGVVVGHLDLIALSTPAGSPGRESADLALDAALRGARLARRLLGLARREPVARDVVDLAAAVRGLVPLLQHAAGTDTEVAVRADSTTLVHVDHGELDAALINLTVNARAAMPGGGRLTIGVETMALDVVAAAELSVPPGEYAALSVHDTGCGMSAAVLRRIGEPFFSTRPGTEGTGLGVSMVHAFVRQSGGLMQVQSDEGAGSTFRLLLPTAQAAQDGQGTLPIEFTTPAPNPDAPA
ncbi:MAG: PAS domain-containing protein [Vicinamibacterales bacterium]